MPTFREYVQRLAPPWLLTGDGAVFMGAIGEVKDALLWRARQAVMTRFPSFATASAVGLLGAERGIPRGVDEDLAPYAERVRTAWDAWAYAGTALGLLRALHATGYTNAEIAIFNGRRYALDADGELVVHELGPLSWLFRSTTDLYWSRFIVLFPEPLIPRWVADGVPSSSSDEANTIRSLVRKWKPAHMRTEAILVATSPETFDYFPPGGTWDDAGATWGDETQWTIWSP